MIQIVSRAVRHRNSRANIASDGCLALNAESGQPEEFPENGRWLMISVYVQNRLLAVGDAVETHRHRLSQPFFRANRDSWNTP